MLYIHSFFLALTTTPRETEKPLCLVERALYFFSVFLENL